MLVFNLVGKFVVNHRCEADLTDVGEIVGQLNPDVYVLRHIWADDKGPTMYSLLAIPGCWEGMLIFDSKEQMEIWFDDGEEPQRSLRIVSFQQPSKKD